MPSSQVRKYSTKYTVYSEQWGQLVMLPTSSLLTPNPELGCPLKIFKIDMMQFCTLRNVAHFEVGRTHQTQWKCLVCTRLVVAAHLLSCTLIILWKVSVQSTPLLWHGMTRTYKMIEHDTLLHAISAGFRTDNQTMFTQTTLFRIVHSSHTGSCYHCTVRWFSIRW